MEQMSLFETFNIFSGLFFLVSLSSIILGIVVLAKGSNEKINRLLFFLSLIISIESFGYGLAFWTTNVQDVYFCIGIACIGYCLIWPAATHFLVEFSFGKISKGWLINLIILYFVAIFYVITWFTGLTASESFERIKYGWLDHPNQSIFYYIYIVYLVHGFISMLVIYCLAERTYGKNRKNNKKAIQFGNSEKQFNKIKHIRVMFASAGVSIVFGILFNVVFPICGIKIPSIGFLSMFIFVLACSYCIIKYHSFVLKKEISPIVIDNVGEIVIVVSDKLDVIYTNDTFFTKLKLEHCDPALINVSDFLCGDLNQLISLDEFNNNKKGNREVELLCYDKKTRIQTKMVSTPVILSRKQKVIVLIFSDISHRIKRLMNNQDNLLEKLAFAADGKSHDLHNHIYRMSAMTAYIADNYKKIHHSCDLPTNEDIKKAALFHDIGKISVRDSILNKPEKLTSLEFSEIKRHTRDGYDILSCMEGSVYENAAIIALNHHENWNGDGYPNSISGDKIPLIARIAAVADVVDALLTKRVYKDAMSEEQVEEFLKEERGKRFDPEIVDIIFQTADGDGYRCFDGLIKIYRSF